MQDSVSGDEGGATPGASEPGYRFYRESDLVVHQRTPRAGLPRLVNELVRAAGAPQREQLIGDALHSLGFEWLAYSSGARHSDGSRIPAFLTTYANAPWVQRYILERHYEVDPRTREASCSSLPLVWDCADVDARLPARRVRGPLHRFADDLRNSGIRSGVLFNIPSRSQDNDRTVISLMASAPTRAWIGDAVLGQAMTLGFSLHEFYTQHASLAPRRNPVMPERAGLPATQREIIGHLLHGRSDKEIAALLRLSAYTVDYHMRQLRQRFSARNRLQIVSAVRQAAALERV